MKIKKEIPVEKNKEYEVEILDLSSEGSGIARIEGYTVFVEGTLPGEKVKILIVNTKSNYGYGKVLEIIKPSSNRVTPKCPAYKRCGGCNLQHMDYDAQLVFKTKQVKDAVERIAGLKDVVIKDTIGMDKPVNYRNKVQMPVNQNGELGFYAKRTHTVIPIDNCIIQTKENDRLMEAIKELIKRYSISIYDEKTGKGVLRHIVTRKAFHTNELMVIFVVNGDKLPYKEEIITKLTKELKNIKSIILNRNQKATNVILGKKNETLYGADTIQDNIGEYIFNISPLSFFQVNPVQTEVLYEKALEYAKLTGEETVIDAYCGIGTISLFLSKHAKKVYAVEIVPEAIEDAKLNAKTNNVENIEFICGESEVIIPKMEQDGIKADIIVIDPPRKGCELPMLEAIIKMQPQRVVYVSCNPATMARDIKELTENNYKVEEIQPVDMFPWTTNVECVVKLVRVGE